MSPPGTALASLRDPPMVDVDQKIATVCQCVLYFLFVVSPARTVGVEQRGQEAGIVIFFCSMRRQAEVRLIPAYQ